MTKLGKFLNETFYGEWVAFDGEKEKAEAILYLKLWTKFYLKREKLELVGLPDLIIKEDMEMCSLKTDKTGVFVSTAAIKFAAIPIEKSD